MDPPGKCFLLENTFEAASSMYIGEIRVGNLTEHFGIQWRVGIQRLGYQFVTYLIAQYPEMTKEPIINLSCKYNIVSKSGCRWSTEHVHVARDKTFTSWSTIFHNWQTILDSLIVDDNLTMEVEVEINKIIGFYKPNLRAFDVTLEEFSDVVLVVQDQEFYVLKQFLALHSPVFKAMFLGDFAEAQQPKIILRNVHACDFQNFLELLYGDLSIDELTVEGMLSIADVYDTNIVRQKCQDFLIHDSRKLIATKLRLAEEYNLTDLKTMCANQLKTKQMEQKEAVDCNKKILTRKRKQK